MTIYIASKRRQTIEEAWAESEGWYSCADHYRDLAWDLDDEYRLVPVPAEAEAQIKKEGQCDGCWSDWADAERIRHETTTTIYCDTVSQPTNND